METYRLHERWVLRYSSLIRWIVMSRDDFGDALGSETRYRRIMSIIAPSRETTPTHVQRVEIAYILLLRAQSWSTIVNWAAPSDTDIAIDENDYITPEPVWLTGTQRDVTGWWYLSQHGYLARLCPLAFPFPGVYLSRSMCAYGGEAFRERNLPTEINYTTQGHTQEKLSNAKAHLRWESRYCDRILDVHLRFRRIPTAMTAYAIESKRRSFKLTPPKLIRVEWIPFLRIPSQLPTMLRTLMHCTRHLAAIRKYYQQWTINRPGNKRIPNWSCGTTLTTSISLFQDDNQVSQWLARGAHKHRDFLISRLFIPCIWWWGNVIDHLCTGEVDACNLNFELLQFQLGTCCW